MGKKISETKLVAQFGAPNVSWGNSKTLATKPTLVFNLGDGSHVTIYPDDAWNFSQMGFQSEDAANAKLLHTTIDEITFDEWHLTDNRTKGSVFVDLNGKIGPQSDGSPSMQTRALELHKNVFV
jgi:hypothetical protein